MVNGHRRPHRSTEDSRKLSFCGFLQGHTSCQTIQESWAFSSHFGANWPASKFFLVWSSLSVRFVETKGRVRKYYPRRSIGGSVSSEGILTGHVDDDNMNDNKLYDDLVCVDGAQYSQELSGTAFAINLDFYQP